MAVTRRTAIGLLVPAAALAIDPKQKAIPTAAKAARTAEMTDAWLRSRDKSATMVYIEPMDLDFHKLVVGEIHRRNKISLRITTVEENASFRLGGEVKRKEDLPEQQRDSVNWNGAKHFATLSLVSIRTGAIIWACHEDDRNKFDFNSTGRTLRRVAERCVNHLVKAITQD